jgi:hypothetical protein
MGSFRTTNYRCDAFPDVLIVTFRRAAAATPTRSAVRKRLAAAHRSGPLEPHQPDRRLLRAPAQARREGRAPAAQDAKGLAYFIFPFVKSPLYDQAASPSRRPPLLHLLPYLSGNRNHGLSAKWGHAGTRPANRCTSVAPYHKLYDRTKDEISLDEVERIKF